MVTVLYDQMEYYCSHAAKSDHEVVLYDNDWNILYQISNIDGEEWNYIQLIEGEWEEIRPEPTQEELLQLRLDRIQADLDYCLMLLDE